MKLIFTPVILTALVVAACLTGSLNGTVIATKVKSMVDPVVKPGEDGEPCFLVLSDIHLRDDKKQFDAYNKSGDSGNDLWDTVQKKIKNLLSTRHPKFILLLGDLPFHTENRRQAMHDMSIVLNNIQKLAGNIPVIYVPGNNDSPYGHNGPPSLYFMHNHGTCDTCWPLYRKGVQPHPALLNYDTTLGCYACYPVARHTASTPELRVIALNSVLLMKGHIARNGTTAQAEATHEMDWLAAQLADAEKNNDKVLLTMHVPPGKDYLGKDFWDTLKYTMGAKTETVQNAFLDMVAKYKDRIAGVLTSHTHLDGVRKLYAGGPAKFIALGLSIPGVAPGHGNYPGMDVVTYNPENYALLNFETWYLPYEHAADSANKPLLNTWKDFDFNSVFHNSKNAPMLQFVETLNDDSLQHPIFLRENESVFKFFPDKGVEVKYQ